MTLLVFSKKDDGIAQAWAMATLGSLLAHRRTLRKTVIDMSIPQTCQLIISSPTNSLPLRISSNLLYGMSLIYKQKVTYMFNELVSVYSRLSVPLFSNIPTESYTLGVAAKRTNIKQYMVDDAKFNISEDFSPSLDLEPSDAIDLILQIKEQDNLLNFMNPTSVPLAVEADARDRLFEIFMEKSYASVYMEPETEYDVDFEFDKNGQIIGHDLGNADNHNFLQDADFDQDLHVVSASATELSKTQNTGTNDAHFSTTANQSGPEEQQENPRKRRRVRLIKDTRLTFEMERNQPSTKSVQTTKPTFPEVIELLSRKTPQFVNSCYRALFGRAATLKVPNSRFPLTDRHPALSKTDLNSFFDNLVDIEEGRNYVSPHVSFEQADLVMRHQQAALEENFTDFNFDLDLNYSPDISMDEIWPDNETESIYARMLSKFHAFVQSKLAESQDHKVTFEVIVPSQATASERPVNKKYAASAFASLLQLATKDQLHLESFSCDGYLTVTSDIYVRE